MPDYDVQIYATFKDLSQDTTIQSITVLGVNAQADSTDDTVYSVTLPFGTNISSLTAIDIVVSLPLAAGSSICKIKKTTDSSLTWTVIVVAEDGRFTQTYTINVSVSTTLLYTALASITTGSPKTYSNLTGLKQIIIQAGSINFPSVDFPIPADVDTIGIDFPVGSCVITAPTGGDATKTTSFSFQVGSSKYTVAVTATGEFIIGYSITKNF